MVAKKDETVEPAEVVEEVAEPTPEVVEPTEVEAVVDEKPNLNKKTQVAGRIDPREMDSTPVNICVECGWTGPTNKGKAWCPACGGKTKQGLKYQAKTMVAADDARFTGKSAEDSVEKKDE